MNISSGNGSGHLRHLAAGLSVMILVLSHPAVEPLAGGADSLCLHFISSESNVRLELREQYTLDGKLPVTICTLKPGTKYRLTVEGHGFEKRMGTFVIEASGRPKVNGIAAEAVLRNAVVPGWGSIYSEKAMAGITDLFSVAASATILVLEEFEYLDLKDSYDSKMERLSGLEDYVEAQRLSWEAYIASREVNVQNKHMKRMAVLTAALYGHQVLDAVISNLPPGVNTGAGGSIVDFTPAGESVAKAFLHSLIRPGRGQFYQGKNARGAFFSISTVAAGLVALDYHNSYDKDVNRYNLALERFNRAALLEEKEFYKGEADRLWEAVEDSKRRRNISYIVLAGLWGLGLIDTLVPGEGDSSSGYSFELSPQGGAFVMRF